MPDPEPKLIVLKLRPLAKWNAPWPNRLRGLLKSALRAYGFKCESVESAPDSQAPTEPLTPDERSQVKGEAAPVLEEAP